jgi:hypothetical protein
VIRRGSFTRAVIGCLAFGAVVCWGFLPVDRGFAQSGKKAAESTSATPAPAAATLSDAESEALAERFRKEIWPLLTRASGNCVGCHNDKNPSQLHFFDDPDRSFKRLLAEGFFDPDSPTSILARVTASRPAMRMPPPPALAWTDAEVAALRSFADEVFEHQSRAGVRMDEMFPPALLNAIQERTNKGARRTIGPDNTFVSFRQLKGKIQAIFGDDWRRDERDLFNENIAMFGGADFRRRFDETTKPNATFLSAVDLMSRDVASRAYLLATGPFRGRPASLPSPLGMRTPDSAYRREIQRLYDRMLFRSATEPELRRAFALLQSIYRAQDRLADESSDLTFELEVQDEHGLATTQNFTIPVGRDRRGLYQQFIDENVPSEQDVVRQKLDTDFSFKASDKGQQFRISNANTYGNVSIHAIELAPRASGGVTPGYASGAPPGRSAPEGHRRLAGGVTPGSPAWRGGNTPGVGGEAPNPEGPKGASSEATTTLIPVTDPSVSIEGAWRQRTNGDFSSYEDGNDNKGSSSITIPIRVPRDGRYELAVLWRKGYGKRNAPSVLVEVLSQDKTRLALPPAPPVPPKGEAHFFVDQSVDSIAFWDLKTSFRFATEGEGVEVNNAGTRNRVVADAVRFVPVAAGSTLLLDNDEADGSDQWEVFRTGDFTPYNITGKDLITDNGKKKGELKLLYRPGRHKAAWSPKSFYRVEVGFPGKADNETRAPVIVHASESSPIIQLSVPQRAQVGASVTMDASATYNLQRSLLRFTWKQIGGPRVKLSDPHAPRVTFTAVPKTAEQAAWESLCRALMKHPDFLFTRPRSLASRPGDGRLPVGPRATDPREWQATGTGPSCVARRHLQLVKIAQDLVARTPTEAELRKLDAGAPLSALVNDYLASPEFRSFYFHRIRLYLESHGTDEEDEPARLWCYVAFNNRPFKEILTADYSVDASFLKRPRPAYYGKTGLLTMKGFIKGKPGLPHFNYAAQVCEKFLGYVFEVPPEVVAMRDGITAVATASPSSLCYSCHKVLTPLAFQRTRWTDDGDYREKDEAGKRIDDTDQKLVPSYPFRGQGMEAFALQAQNKERFIRTIIQTHFVFYFGREMRYDQDERGLYKRLWDTVHADGLAIKGLIRALLTSPEYLDGRPGPDATSPSPGWRVARK